MIRFHREGKNILIISTVIFFLLSVTAFIILTLLPYFIIQAALFVLIIMIFRFFRKPNRKIETKHHSVLAPADGTVVAIERVTESEYFNDERIQVSIFMSIHNIHINWYPCTGKIKYCKYHPGKYLIARYPKSSLLNEHTSTVIENGQTEILVKQIAGFVARRIVCYAEVGRTINTSQELGFIKFGSRLDIFLPVSAELQVTPGQKTRGGITEIAAL